MARSARTQSELVEDSRHLYYEVWMFESAATELGEMQASDAVKNALMESFAIHTRALIGFFFMANPRETDVVAADFVPAGDPWLAGLDLNRFPILDAVYKRVNKEIAHLTRDRIYIPPEAKDWDIHAIHGTMMPLVRGLALAAPDAHLDLGIWNRLRGHTLLISPKQGATATNAPSSSTTVMVNSPSVNKLS